MNLLLVYLAQIKLNKVFNYLLLFFVGIILFSCTSNESKVEHNLLLVDNKLINYEYVLIIPNEGCGACISDATSYVIENFEKITPKTAVVFTDIKDFKAFKLILNSNILESEHVFIDSSNILKSIETASVYPQIVTIDDKKVESLKVFNKALLVLD
jgi:hypothetical protein